MKEKLSNTDELLALELLKIVKTDVKASRVLYGNRLYAQSYFYFQQATEKATKALSLLLKMSTAKQTFNIRHDIFKLHKASFLQAKEDKQKALALAEALPFFATSGIIETEKIKEQLEKSEQSLLLLDNMKELDLIKIPAKDINLFLENIQSLELKRLRMPDDLEKRIDGLFIPFIDKMELHESKAAKYIANELRNALESKEFGDFIREHFADVIKSFVHVAYAHAVLYFSG